jgi:hypothetical protein
VVHVHADVVLAVVLGEERHGHVLPEAARVAEDAGDVALSRHLDLDHLGPELPEEVRGGGAEDDDGQVEDADPPERLRLGVAPGRVE